MIIILVTKMNACPCNIEEPEAVQTVLSLDELKLIMVVTLFQLIAS